MQWIRLTAVGGGSGLALLALATDAGGSRRAAEAREQVR